MGRVYLERIRQELQKGSTEKGHPFRYFTFATVGPDQEARLRTVVMRAVDKDLKITFYTDMRPNHIRIRFSKVGNQWGKEFLAP